MATPRRSSKQSGGTLLGLVLGLIVGLAIAVVVALYITRSPTPFVTHNPPAPGETGASAGQAVDLNRSLQGKSPGQAVPETARPAPPNTAPGQSAGEAPNPQIIEVPPSNDDAAGPSPAPAPAPAQPAPKAPAPRQSAAASAPAPRSPAAASAAPAQATANTGYFLQVGAYRTAQDAEQQRARLALQGFESKVSQRDSGGVTYYRVRIGPFAKFDDMNEVRQRLSDAGVDTAVIRFQQQ